MGLPSPTDDDPRPPPRITDRLRRIWVGATAETINRDLEVARRLARQAGPDESAEVERYLRALERLERWLHDL